MAWSYTYDIDTPAGDDDPAEADDRMREIKGGLQERLNVEHVFDLTGSEVSHLDSGKHADITTTSIVNAGALANTGNVTINTDKFTIDAATGNVVVAGKLDVTGNIDPNTFETTNGGFLDEDSFASDAANKVASQQSIKAYIAAQITANQDPAYAGGQSHTFNGGLIIKMGRVTTLAAQEHRTVTFGVAFPNNLIVAGAFLSKTPTSINDAITVHTESTTKIEIESRLTASAAYWIAIGN